MLLSTASSSGVFVLCDSRLVNGRALRVVDSLIPSSLSKSTLLRDGKRVRNRLVVSSKVFASVEASELVLEKNPTLLGLRRVRVDELSSGVAIVVVSSLSSL